MKCQDCGTEITTANLGARAFDGSWVRCEDCVRRLGLTLNPDRDERLKAAEEVVEAAQAMFPWTDAYEDHMVGEDFARRDEARNAFSRALTEYKQIVAKGKGLNDG